MKVVELTPEIVAEMIALYQSGMTCEEVGEELGYSGTRVGKRLKALGITRTASQTAALKRANRGPVDKVTVKVPKNAPRCKVCTVVIESGDLCDDCLDDKEKGIVYTGKDTGTPPARDEDLTAIRTLLEPIIPEGAQVVAKGKMMLIDWTSNAVCQYCRVMIWFGLKHSECIEGTTFCLRHCEGLCATEPGPCREAAFVKFVTEQVHEWEVRTKQDRTVSDARYRMEKAGEVMWSQREVRM